MQLRHKLIEAAGLSGETWHIRVTNVPNTSYVIEFGLDSEHATHHCLLPNPDCLANPIADLAAELHDVAPTVARGVDAVG